MSSDLLILSFHLMHVFWVFVDDERLDNLHEVECDREHVHSQIVNVDVEAIALI